MVNQVYFKKNITGNIYLALEDYEGLRPERVFTFSPQQVEIGIPFNYACSIFSNSSNFDFYNKGIIVPTKNWTAFVKVLEDNGLDYSKNVNVVLPEQKQKDGEVAALTTEQITKILKRGNEKELKKLLSDSITAEETISIANTIPNEITMKTRKFIEEETQIGIGMIED